MVDIGATGVALPFELAKKLKAQLISYESQPTRPLWINPNAIVLSDGLSCFIVIVSAGFEFQSIVTGGGYSRLAIPEFEWLNTVLGNATNSLQGSYYQLSGEHLPRYLGEFCYRFNRRFDLAAILTRLGWAAVQTPRMPYRLLRMAEAF